MSAVKRVYCLYCHHNSFAGLGHLWVSLEDLICHEWTKQHLCEVKKKTYVLIIIRSGFNMFWLNEYFSQFVENKWCTSAKSLRKVIKCKHGLHQCEQTTQDHTDFVKVIIVEYFDVFFLSYRQKVLDLIPIKFS